VLSFIQTVFFYSSVGVPIVGSLQLVSSVGFEAMASSTAEFKILTQSVIILHNELQTYSQNSKIGFRSIHVVGEATALFLRSTQQYALSFFAKTSKG
jgi:hypothetical protein